MTLRFRSFFGDSVHGAIAAARKDLGDEAMIVQSRRTAGESESLGRYEVVFAISNPATQPPPSPTPTGHPGVVIGTQMNEPGDWRREMAELKRMIRWLPGASSGRTESNTPIDQLRSRLLEEGVSETAVGEILDSVPLVSQAGPLTETWHSLLARVSSPLHGATGSFVFQGPPAAGSATIVMKLAAQLGAFQGRSIQILYEPNERGGNEKIQYYSTLLGVGCEPVMNGADLASAWSRHQGKSLVLVLLLPRQLSNVATNKEAPAFLREIATQSHFVLPATLRPSVAKTMLLKHCSISPSHLCFTFLDEADRLGTVLEIALTEHIPISYLSSGPSVLEQIEPATLHNLSARLPAAVCEVRQ